MWILQGRGWSDIINLSLVAFASKLSYETSSIAWLKSTPQDCTKTYTPSTNHVCIRLSKRPFTLQVYQFKFCMHFWFLACVRRVSYLTYHQQALYTQIMLVEEYALRSSLPRNFLHLLVTVCSQFQICFSSPRPQLCYTKPIPAH